MSVKHVAVIMDGNGRWAKKRFLNKRAGHRAGAQALKELALEAEKIGISYLTVYAFSTENWGRPPAEIEDLMQLLREYINQYINDEEKNNMRITVIGRRSFLAEDLRENIKMLEEKTRNKNGLHLVIALDYGGRDEILRAVQELCHDVASRRVKPDSVTEELFISYLDTAHIPDPDLLIRTSGELRISNFLLWQSAYTEFYFTDKLWPDFKINDLHEALEELKERQRRFGVRLDGASPVKPNRGGNVWQKG